MEILVTVLIIVTLSAVIIPGLVAKFSDANSASLESDLRAINAAILQYRENTGRYPHELVELTTRPTVGVSLDACGTAVVTSTAANWSGPYLSASVTTSGLQSGDAIIANSLQRNPLVATPSTMNGVLQLSVSNVTGTSAGDLEASFDTGNDLDHGTITWIPTTGIIGTLTFAIPVRGC